MVIRQFVGYNLILLQRRHICNCNFGVHALCHALCLGMSAWSICVPNFTSLALCGTSPVAANRRKATKISLEHYVVLILHSIKILLNKHFVFFEDILPYIRESCSKSHHVVTASQVCSSAMLLLMMLVGVSSNGITFIKRVSWKSAMWFKRWNGGRGHN